MEEKIEPRRGESRGSLSNVTPLDFMRYMPLPTAAAPLKARQLGGAEETYSEAAIEEAATLLGRVDLESL